MNNRDSRAKEATAKKAAARKEKLNPKTKANVKAS